MKNKKSLFLMTVLTVVSLVLVSCAAPATNPEPVTTAKTTADSSSVSSAVSIEGFAFNPETMTVKAGTTVVWTNNDSASHDIKSDSFSSPSMANGQTFEFKFEDKGTYDYSCGIHPTMKGKIIVE